MSSSEPPVAIDDVAIVDALPAAVVVIDDHGTIIRANPRACEVLDRPTLLGLSIHVVLGPWPLPPLSEPMRAERNVVRPDGSPRTVGLAASPIPGGGMVIVFQDLARWQRLRDERDRLMRLAMVGEALPTILHELKNPLAALIAASEILIEDTPAGAVQDQLHAIVGEARRLRLGLDGIGSVGRALASPRYQVIDQACREAFKVLELRANRAGIATRCDVRDLPLLPLEAAVVRAMVFNLVNNAIHACAAGAAINLHARLIDDGRWFELTVVDTGSGMPHDVLVRCTDLFYSTKRNGSGIGLAVVRQAVVDAGGRLDVESVPGFGTGITARIPVTPEARPAA
ncbi:MAG: PAS domain-containing protein [Myxococcales bacterium]|nr:PAS domain-containing protein [Myxococcales bacterium]MBK7198292.1 PAS domain-containing protein [Myxococcales bacterium]MBP6843713.1 PAS domain-containing protein [Kofleriaceae bacterium]